MPLYEAVCKNCASAFEWYSSVVTDETKNCPCCGGEAERIFSSFTHRIFHEFTTRNIDPEGRPIRVTSQSQLSSLCNEHHLVHLDDPKYDAPQTRIPEAHEILGTIPIPGTDRGVEGGACRKEELLNG